MTLRIAAALALVFGVTTFMVYLHLLGKGPFATRPERHLREVKERTTAPAAYETLTVADFASLPRRRPLAEYAPIERRGVIVEGYVLGILRAADGDYHMGIASHPGHRSGPYYQTAIAEITPQWQRGSKTWRYERLAEVFRPAFKGVTDWERGPRRVRIGGWLLYDYPHEGFVPRDRFTLPPIAAWEIHPVTRIEAWDDSLRAFVEVAR